ncbi:hypothetical protein FGG08_003939 [Glutinoglossum americanum]|uniref:CCR4-NOT transcription complex subunit 11 n=1 Tax=Glutinoglossum americanum TaxID=1670608 RepID=A0A9P8IA42_9PEZI|nr:hypothetical protein FGG08_003939 [Glutinoglossum americanum]
MTTASLPPELAVLLTKYRDSFDESTVTFASKLNPDDHFTTACQLLNTLVDLETRGDQTENMFYNALQQGESLSRTELHECLAAFVFNAEYMLFQFYRQYEIRMNPFLSHWVEVIRDWEKTFGRDFHEGKQKAKTTTAIRNVDLDIFSTRVQLVRGILAGEGVKLGSYSPHEFYVFLANTFQSRIIDVSKFEESLEDMEIYDKPAKKQIEHHSTPEDIKSQTVLAPGATKWEEESSEALKDQLISIIMTTAEDHLPIETVDFVMTGLQNDISVITPNLVRFTAGQLPTTVEINFQWTVKLLELILGHRQLRADPKLSDARQELITAITRLPSTIMPMDLITTLLIRGCVEDVPWVVHGFLANALRAIEYMGSHTATSAHTQHLEQYYYESSPLITPFEGGGIPMQTVERGRAAQAQAIRLLTVFINSLVTKRLMSAQELHFEIEEIGVRYIWIPEARGFWGDMRRL